MSNKKYDDVGDPIDRLMEECAELIQILCKVKRFGWNNWHPDREVVIYNHTLVLEEMDDVERHIERVRKIANIYKDNSGT